MDAPKISRPEQGEAVTKLWRHVNKLADAVEAQKRTLDDIEQRVPRRRRMDARAGLVWRGAYDSTASYAINDLVAVIGAGQGVWICQVAHGPGPGDDHAPWLGEDDGTTQYWAILPTAAAGFWI